METLGKIAFAVWVWVMGCIGFALDQLNARTGAPVIGPPVISERDLPPAPDLPRPKSGKRTVSFQADSYGQFWLDGTANGTAFRFLADTGATEIVFSKHDARRLGFDVARLSFDGWASTANGLTRTASARIDRLQVGPFTLTDVTVTINEGDLDSPLLGMAFLRRLHVAIGNGLLTLSDGA